VVAAHVQWQALVVLNFRIPHKVGLVQVNGYVLDSWNLFPLKEFENSIFNAISIMAGELTQHST
jgi:hypothetical protein